jgi:hypothetical protein
MNASNLTSAHLIPSGPHRSCRILTVASRLRIYCQKQAGHILRGFSIESLPYYQVKVYGKPESI